MIICASLFFSIHCIMNGNEAQVLQCSWLHFAAEWCIVFSLNILLFVTCDEGVSDSGWEDCCSQLEWSLWNVGVDDLLLLWSAIISWEKSSKESLNSSWLSIHASFLSAMFLWMKCFTNLKNFVLNFTLYPFQSGGIRFAFVRMLVCSYIQNSVSQCSIDSGDSGFETVGIRFY